MIIPPTPESEKDVSWIDSLRNLPRYCTITFQPHHLTTFMCRLSSNLRALTSWNPQDLSKPVMGLLYLCLWSLPPCVPHPLSSLCVQTVLVGDNVLIIVAGDRRLVLVDSWQEGGRESTSGTEGKVSWAVIPTVYGREYFRGPRRVSRKVGKA